MKLLNKLQLDILKRHIGPFVFCFFTVMFLLLMQFLILHIDKLVGKGLPFFIIVELILTNLAYMVVLAAPMAILVACLMAFGKFSELNELTALRAAGINPIHVINPVLVSALIMSIGLMWFSNYVLPDANQQARSLFIDIRMKKPGFDLKSNEFYDGIDGYTFLVKNVDNEADTLYDVTLMQEPSSDQEKAYLKSKTGSLHSENNGQTLTLYLYDGTSVRYLDRRDDNKIVDVLEETKFDCYKISFDLSDLTFSRSTPDQHERNDRTMKAEAMLAVTDSLDREITTARDKLFDKSFELIHVDELKERDQVERTLASHGPDEEVESPYESSYVALNMLESRKEQNALNRMGVSELRSQKSDIENTISNIDWRVKRIARYMVEVHKKISIPLACVIFVLIGAPIGMYTRKGNLGYAALISTIFLTFYWITIIQGEKLADRLYISPFAGMWTTNIILTVVGGYMVIRLCTSFELSKLWKSDDA